jgi:aspartyl-tRNA(Asn)/glutamyl-tRNA(Gln) amidotransferase subunit B
VAEPTVPYAEALRDFEPVIGLETHVELGTASKMFCGCDTTFGASPNTHTCPVCLGLPGALPVVNAQAIESTIRIGLALHCDIATWCRFARKNYFYPDMPKNFQTSQYDEPLCTDGYLDVDVPLDGGGSEVVRIPIERVHLEEDTGKTLHVGGSTGRIHGASHSLVDYNRAGIPLVEIVTKPVTGTGARPAEVAKAYVTELRDVLRGLGVSDVRMEQGSLRCDVNVSLNSPGPSGAPGRRPRTSTRCARSSAPCGPRSSGRRRGCGPGSGSSRRPGTSTRTPGCRPPAGPRRRRPTTGYFPEPDLVPVAPDAAVGGQRCATPCPRRRRCAASSSRPSSGCPSWTAPRWSTPGCSTECWPPSRPGAPAAEARNWWLGHLAQAANTGGVEPGELPITPEQVARVVALVAEGALTAGLAKQVVDGVLAGEGSPDDVGAGPRPGRRLRRGRAG